ncbi:primosomal protein N' [Candidatus Saccharibacteria bacterium CG_4_10_14_0_2_um_filter_52_9]|nr:MAG: primosomal protein N' [Candidatus Saccharibacteria bacterium CG_4_10_14_0_2_um_filter_52_9]
MNYYFVWVRSSRYHGSTALTYSSPDRIPTGSVVQVELQKLPVLGVVSGPSSQPRFKTKAIDRVFGLPPLPAHLLKLAGWLKDYYPAPLGILTQQLLLAGLSDKQLAAESARELVKPDLSDLPPLTKEQAAALTAMAERDTYLLHGTTGSGKTRLYIELAAREVAAGRSAIILTPEISLTTQLGNSFRQVFGDRVIVMHSQQAPGERRRAWLDCLRATEPMIVIGPRSALFSPLQKPGLIILDEAHEAAYKQEQAPQYQAGRVAATLAQLTRSSLVLGSATPAIGDYYLAEQKQKPIIRLAKLAQPELLTATKVTLVNRKDHSLFSRSPFLSSELIKAVEAALARGEQSLLYLNRRGTARLVLCENCGWQATCPHCDIPLTYHGDKHELRCHSCSHHQPTPGSCPECGHADVIFKTAGTKAVVEEVERLFPNARVARFDTDNAKAERFERHYDTIKKGEVDILVGTQLLAKGLDLPRLSTLGIVLADTSLYLPDFSAQERTFQLISQVLGRIGRGHVVGRAIIQTYHSEHPVLKAAVEGDYQGFYQSELASRRQYLFPPFCYLLKLTVRRASIKSAEEAALKLKAEIEGHYKVRVEGPAPSFYERFQNKYQWQLVVKAKQRDELLKIIDHLPANWSYDIDPLDLL